LRGVSPAISEITSPSSATTTQASAAQQRQDDDVERICDVTLSGLAVDNTISPVKRMDDLEEEDMYDAVDMFTMTTRVLMIEKLNR